jgi:hypothetical protein
MSKFNEALQKVTETSLRGLPLARNRTNYLSIKKNNDCNWVEYTKSIKVYGETFLKTKTL